MIIDCEASIVIPGFAPKFSRARVGLAIDGGSAFLMVITNQFKEKFRITDKCVVRSSTVSFEIPRKDVYIRNADQLMLKSLLKMVDKAIKREPLPKLAKIDDVKKQKPTSTSLSITQKNLCLNELKNQKLTKLVAADLKLVPRLVWNLNNLTELRLVNCQLDEIPERMLRLGKSLKTLDLSRNNLTFLHASFMLAMASLRHLDLSQNRLRFVPLEIVALQNLVHLNLGRNQFEVSLPFTIGKLASLKELRIHDNAFDCFSYSLWNHLKNLKLNNLDMCNLKSQAEVAAQESVSLPLKLSKLCSTEILKHKRLLLYCHQILPKTLYNYIQYNSQTCSVCCCPIAYLDFVGGKEMKSLAVIANCISAPPCPTFPLIHILKYNCYRCR